MRGNQCAYNRQPQARAARVAAARFVGAIEALKHHASLFRLQAIAGVAHGDHQRLPLGHSGDADPAAATKIRP